MGWDPAIFMDHSLKFETASELVSEFARVTQKEVIIHRDSDDQLPHNFKGWYVWLLESETLEAVYRQENLLKFTDASNEDDDELWVSRYSIEVSTGDTAFVPLRWHGVIQWFNEVAQLTAEERKSHPFHQVRKNIFKWAQLFGATKYILFCGDSNQDVQDELWTGSSINDVLKKYSRRIHKVHYSDIDRFHYDEDAPRSSRIYKYTFIIDEFEDLRV